MMRQILPLGSGGGKLGMILWVTSSFDRFMVAHVILLEELLDCDGSVPGRQFCQ